MSSLETKVRMRLRISE